MERPVYTEEDLHYRVGPQGLVCGRCGVWWPQCPYLDLSRKQLEAGHEELAK